MFFLHANHLGSNTMVTHYDGEVMQKNLFYPFGQNWVQATGPGGVVSWRFAGLREGLPGGGDLISQSATRDYPGRHYRWMSPDPLAGDISNPQSLNRYAYVLNNPTNLTDPLGLDPPHNPTYQPYDPCFGDPLCRAYGPTTAGNNIFDAISGSPGTYLSYDMYGNMSFGFSIDLWRQTNGVIAIGRQINEAEGYDPAEIPTTGYTVVQRDLGTPDINAQYAMSGLVPDLQRVEEERRWLVAQLPAGYQNYYKSWFQFQGPWGALNMTFNKLAQASPSTFVPLAPFMNYAQNLYAQVNVYLLGFWGM
jgi:RHS repeat-associated protein